PRSRFRLARVAGGGRIARRRHQRRGGLRDRARPPPWRQTRACRGRPAPPGAQSPLAHAPTLLETAAEGETLLTDGDDALSVKLAQLVTRLDAAAVHDPAVKEIVALLEPAAIQIEEAARALRD